MDGIPRITSVAAVGDTQLRVRVDTGGYGISWNDAIDLSEYELWTHGRA